MKRVQLRGQRISECTKVLQIDVETKHGTKVPVLATSDQVEASIQLMAFEMGPCVCVCEEEEEEEEEAGQRANC